MPRATDRVRRDPREGPGRSAHGRWLVCVLAVAAFALAGGSCSSDESDESGPGTSGTSSAAPHTTVAAPIEPVSVSQDDQLYAIPDPIPDAPPGTLLRYQPVERSGRPGRYYRIMYTSTTVGGDPTVVTGIAVVPPGRAPDGGWRVLTHGHGSTGLADDCAPSRALGRKGSERLLAELDVLSQQATPAGYVVASSDYEGQGGPGRHPFLVGVSEARSLLDAAVAVSSLPDVETDGTLSIAGYSQGGHAAVWARQLAAERTPDLDVVGTVAGAPSTELVDLVRSGAQGSVLGSFPAMVAAGQAAGDAELDLDAALTPTGRSMIEELDASCAGTSELDPRTDAMRVDVTTDETWRRALVDSTPGQTAGTGPLLIVHSREDRNVPVEESATLQRRLCERGADVERRVLPTGDHVLAAVPTYQQGVAWLAELHDGARPASPCPP